MAYINGLNATLLNIQHGLISYNKKESNLLINSDSGKIMSFKDAEHDEIKFNYSNSYVVMHETSDISFNSRIRNGLLESEIKFNYRSRNGLLDSEIEQAQSISLIEINKLNQTNILFTDYKIHKYIAESNINFTNKLYKFSNINSTIEITSKATKQILQYLNFYYYNKSSTISNILTSNYSISQLAFPGTEEGFREYAAIHFTHDLDLDSIVYVDLNTMLTPECSIHGSFSILPYDMVQLETGCPKCDIHLKAEEIKTRAEISYQHYMWIKHLRCNNIRIP